MHLQNVKEMHEMSASPPGVLTWEVGEASKGVVTVMTNTRCPGSSLPQPVYGWEGNP